METTLLIYLPPFFLFVISLTKRNGNDDIFAYVLSGEFQLSA